MGYPNKTILETLNHGIQDGITSCRERLFASDGRLALTKIYEEEGRKYRKLQKILNLKGVSDGKKIHYYLKAADLPTDIDLDIFIKKLTHENKSAVM